MIITDLDFDKLKQKILNARGLDLSQYSKPYVERRINARFIALGINSIQEYLEVLNTKEEEYQDFLNAFSINTTEFFRDITVWNVIENKYFPETINRKAKSKSPVLSIWSCACSTGEEPYTIAILLNECLLRTGLKDKLQLKIIATDIDKDALKAAQKGEYPQQNMKNIPEQYKSKYFKKIENETKSSNFMPDFNNLYKISGEIAKMVDFRYHNFIKDTPPFFSADIIFCRNVIIYLKPEMKSCLIETFYRSLAPNGMLVLGKTELLLTNRDTGYFKFLDIKEHIFEKECIRRN